MSTIRASGLSVKLGKREILRGVDFEIGKGEIVGLIGPNGSGKTTLVRTLAGLVSPACGSFRLEDVSGARGIAYLPQERMLHWPLKVRAVVMLGRIPHRSAWHAASAEDEQAVEEALRETGTLHLADRSFDHLAGGEKAMVLLARVLAGRPRVILADEPVAGLDPHHEMEVMELLRRSASRGATVLVVLHNLTLAARYCDRLLLLNEGSLLAQGNPREVLSPANLENAYRVKAVYGESREGFYVVPWERTSTEKTAGTKEDRAPREFETPKKTEEKGLILVNTGDGKGKSTAAFGTALRAVGQGMNVAVVQFIKGSWKTGETEAAKAFGERLKFFTMGEGFTWQTKDFEKDVQAARKAWEKCREVLHDTEHQLVIFDEINYCFRYNFLDPKEVAEELKKKPPMKHVFLTGGGAPKEITEIADLVTEMRCEKHPYQKGIIAQRGIEF